MHNYFSSLRLPALVPGRRIRGNEETYLLSGPPREP